MRDHYIKLGCPEKKITVLPNTINVEVFDRYPVKEDIIETHKSEYTLVYTGGINLHRGLDFLLETMPLVQKHCPGTAGPSWGRSHSTGVGTASRITWNH